MTYFIIVPHCVTMINAIKLVRCLVLTGFSISISSFNNKAVNKA